MNNDPVAPKGRDTVLPLHKGPTALKAYQRAIRKWGGHLDVYELPLALQIIDRTLGWQHSSERISTHQLLNGGKEYTGLRMSRAKMFDALNSLEAKGVIRRCAAPDGDDRRVYSVNIDWMPVGPSHELPPSSRKTSQSALRTGPVREMDTIERTEIERKEQKEDYSGSPSALPVPKQIILGRAEAQRGFTSRRSALSVSPKEEIAAIEATWKIALEAAFPEAIHVSWSVREKAQVKAKSRAWLHARKFTFADFTDWAVRNWSEVVAKQFRWMTRSPAPHVPAIGFYLSFLDNFAECWGEGKLEAWLSSPERTQMERLIGRGLSEAEAAAEIGKSRAVVVMREENRQVRIEARARVRRAEIIEKRTLAIAELPIHPDSLAARRLRGETVAPKRVAEDLPEIDWENQPALDPNWEPPY